MFLPDLTSAHYETVTCEHLKSENIEFVPKYLNPENIPKTKQIEDFWAFFDTKNMF